MSETDTVSAPEFASWPSELVEASVLAWEVDELVMGRLANLLLDVLDGWSFAEVVAFVSLPVAGMVALVVLFPPATVALLKLMLTLPALVALPAPMVALPPPAVELPPRVLLP